MAAQMRALDLVIAVDTMAAHLAGALGVPVWTLLHEDCDWRWMSERSDSPWYPTMRLFRQRPRGGWDSVIDNVIAALRVSQRTGFASSPQPSQDSRARYSLSRL
jgi:ADP-heptose:LPS heptosyltransferase